MLGNLTQQYQYQEIVISPKIARPSIFKPLIILSRPRKSHLFQPTNLATDILALLRLLSAMSAPNCPCPKKDCPRHGSCQECVDFHKVKDELPFCAR